MLFGPKRTDLRHTEKETERRSGVQAGIERDKQGDEAKEATRAQTGACVCNDANFTLSQCVGEGRGALLSASKVTPVHFLATPPTSSNPLPPTLCLL